MTKEIILTRGQTTLVDDEWFDYLNQWRWRAISVSSRYPNEFYAGRSNPDSSVVWMHRVVNSTPDGLVTDHIDGNTLNNTSVNLRSATQSQNLQNQSYQRHNTSGYKGVTFNFKKWVARISINNTRIHLGCFDTPEDAARAYDTAAKKHFGVFAKTNF